MPPFYFFGFIALEIISHFALPIYSLEYEPYNYLGILIIALGLSLNLVSKRTVVNGKTTIIPFQEPSALVTKGLFQYSRNPMYLGMVLILFGEAITLGSISTFVFPVLFILIIKAKFIRHEETILEASFKDEFVSYKEHVRRWI